MPMQYEPTAVEDGSLRRRARGGRRRFELADLILALAVLASAAYYVRLARRHFFAYDDWGAAARPGRLGDLVEPFNGHLSVIPLVVYRSLFRVFGFEHYAPFRPLGIACLAALAVGLYLLARHRIGAWPALVVAVGVLWTHSLALTPFLFNFHLALLLGVVCAAALPSSSRAADGVVAAALTVALCTSAVGVAIAGACAAHAVLSGFRLRRWLAVAVPSLGWVLWWARFAVHDRNTTGSLSDGARTVLDGGLGSFAAVVAGTFVGGAALAVGSACLLAWRTAHDRDAARMQVAWMAGVVVWWVGLVWSRENAASSLDTPRYEYVGAVFVLLSLIPTRPADRLRRRARHPAIAVLALASVLAVVAANQPSIRTGARDKGTISTWVRNVLVEVDQGPAVVPDSQVLPHFLYHLTAGELRALVDRRGRPMARSDDADAYLVSRAAIIIGAEVPAPDRGPCLDQPGALRTGSDLLLHTDADPALVSARRFASRPIPARQVPAGTTVRIRLWGPSVATEPWMITAPGGCLVAVPPVAG